MGKGKRIREGRRQARSQPASLRPADLATVVYKYMDGRFATRLVEDGCVRINTLHYFHDVEHHGSQVGDSEEGVLYTEIGGRTIDQSDPSTHNPSIARLFESGRVTFADPQRILGDLVERTADCYVFCASNGTDGNAMRSMGYDTCLEIGDIGAFASIVTDFFRSAGLDVDDPIMGRVVYRSRRATHDTQTSIDPVFIKPDDYGAQDEFRVFWPARDSSITHVDVQDPRLAELVRVVSV